MASRAWSAILGSVLDQIMERSPGKRAGYGLEGGKGIPWIARLKARVTSLEIIRLGAVLGGRGCGRLRIAGIVRDGVSR